MLFFINYTSYAVSPLDVDIASIRVEDSRSFSQNCGSESHNFVKKDKTVPRCCRRNRHSGLARGRNSPHRVTRVN